MVIGFGDLARRLVPKLSGVAEIVGVSRRPELLPEGVTAVFGDYTQRDTLAEAASLSPDVVIFTPVPASRDLEGYRLGYAQAAGNICEAGVLTPAERAIFVSSTRVYAEKAGGWVTEDSPLAGGDPYVDALLDGEACFRRHATTTVLRPSGLYDGARPIMLKPIIEGLKSQLGTGYTNRIHREDVASVLAYLIALHTKGAWIPSTLSLNDNEPVKTADLEAWCFEQLGREPTGERENQPRGNRRISNAKLLATGFQLRYPTFREGYRDTLMQYR